MEYIDSEDNSVVGNPLGGNTSVSNNRDANTNEEIKSSHYLRLLSPLGIDYVPLIEESLNKLKNTITDGKEQLAGCRQLEKLSVSRSDLFILFMQ